MGHFNWNGKGLLALGFVSALATVAAGCGKPADAGGNTGTGTVSGPADPNAAGTGVNNGIVGTGGSSQGAIPCEVNNVVKSRCQMCHGATPIAGAPMSLVTLADFQAMYTAHTTQVLKGQTYQHVYQLASIRINAAMGTTRMPQGTTMAPAEFSTLDSWFNAGAPAGAACGATGTGTPGTGTPTNSGAGAGAGTGTQPGTGTGTMGTGNPTGTGPTGAAGAGSPTGGGPTGTDMTGTTNQCNTDPAAMAPLVAGPGETCYEFQAHGTSGVGDKSKFNIPIDESYNQFYYSVPWPAGSVASRFGARFDNIKILHHWLGFAEASPGQAPGAVVPNVTGTTLGEGAELIGGWAIGGCNTVMPPDVGIKLPDSGEIMIQWHHFNSTGTPQTDGTAVQWCTKAASSVAHVAGITFLGTENLGMPPGMSSKSGTCTNNSGAPITIIGFSPHMHTIGIHMKSEVMHAGQSQTIFDQPFVFDSQVNYMLHPAYQFQPGDSITSTCTFNNTTAGVVDFGQSTTSEMCYQFTIAYPYGALNNGVISLIGATNTCW